MAGERRKRLKKGGHELHEWTRIKKAARGHAFRRPRISGFRSRKRLKKG